MWRDTMMWHFSFIELDDVAEVCVTTKVTMKSNIYTPFPQTKWFVVRWRHESAVVVNEGDRIDSPQMTVVFLCDLARPCVPLKANQLRCSHDCTKLWRCSVNKHTAVLHEYTIIRIFTFKVQCVLYMRTFLFMWRKRTITFSSLRKQFSCLMYQPQRNLACPLQDETLRSMVSSCSWSEKCIHLRVKNVIWVKHENHFIRSNHSKNPDPIIRLNY